MKIFTLISLVMFFGAFRLYAQTDSTFWERITTLIGPSVDCFSSTEDGKIALSGKTGVSAVYISTDGADSWRTTSVKGEVKGVHAASADNLIAAVDENIYHSSDTGKTWRSVSIGWKPILDRNNIKVSLRQVYSPARGIFIAFIGVYHDRDTISFTTTVWYSWNLGISWDSVASLPMNLHGIQYLRDNGVLFATGTKEHNRNEYRGAIAASWDNGWKWRMITDTLTQYTGVSGVIAFNNLSLMAACGSRGLYGSNDTGKTWHRMPSPENSSVDCIEKNDYGAIFIGSKERIYTSVDTGKTWVGHSINNDTVGVYSIHCTKRSVILMTSAGIYRDTAFPSVFTREYDSIIVNNIGCIGLSSPTTIFVGFDGGSALSTDKGETWRNTTSHDLLPRAACITNRGTLLLSSTGSRSTYPWGIQHTQRSTDNGETWQDASEIQLYSNTEPLSITSFFPMGDTIIAGFSAAVKRSTDDGQTWRFSMFQYDDSKPPVPFVESLNSHYRTRNGTYLAGGEYGIACSTDGGVTYKPVTYNTDVTHITGIVRHPKTGRLFATKSKYNEICLFYSDNDGTTWLPHDYDSSWIDGLQKLAIDSMGNIYITSWYNIYRSSDNGATWKDVPTSGLAPDFGDRYGSFFGGSPFSAFVVGSDGRLYLGMRDGGLYRSKQRYPPVGVQEEQPVRAIQELPLRITPNPVGDMIHWNIPDGTAIITNVLGRQVLALPASAQTADVSGLAAGVYVLTVRAAAGAVSRMFVKE